MNATPAATYRPRYLYAEGYESARLSGADKSLEWLVGMIQATAEDASRELVATMDHAPNPYTTGRLAGFTDLLKFATVGS